MAEKKKYNSILISGRKDETLTYSKYVKDDESGESVKESLDKKVNITDELTTQQIKDGAITNEKMAASSITTEKIKDKNVTNEKLADNAVSTSKIASRSVTNEKIAYNSVSRAELTPYLRSSIDKKADAEQVNNSLYNLEKKIGDRFVIEGDVTNLPDEEDLTSVKESERDVLKLADRSYAPEKFIGKGYKILRRNINQVSIAVTNIQIESAPSADGTLSFTINGKETQVAVSATTENTTALVAQKVASALQKSMTEYDVSIDVSLITLTRKFDGSVTPYVFSASTTGVVCTITDSTKIEFRNILTPVMINQPNTIYEIRYDFDLNGRTINIPENCTLKFEGGSLSNGTIVGKDTTIKAELVKIFNTDITISGTWKEFGVYPEWFGSRSEGIEDDAIGINAAINNTTFYNIILQPNTTYNTIQSIILKNNISFGCLFLEAAHEGAKNAYIINASNNHIITTSADIMNNTTIKNIYLNKANGYKFNGDGIHVENVSNIARNIFKGIRVYDCYNGAFFGVVGYKGYTINKVEDCVFNYNRYGFTVSGASTSDKMWINLNTWLNCNFSFNTLCGLRFKNTSLTEQNAFISCGFEGNGRNISSTTTVDVNEGDYASYVCGAYLEGSAAGVVSFYNCYFENNKTNDFKSKLDDESINLNEVSGNRSSAEIVLKGGSAYCYTSTFNLFATAFLCPSPYFNIAFNECILGYNDITLDYFILVRDINNKSVFDYSSVQVNYFSAYEKCKKVIKFINCIGTSLLKLNIETSDISIRKNKKHVQDLNFEKQFSYNDASGVEYPIVTRSKVGDISSLPDITDTLPNGFLYYDSTTMRPLFKCGGGWRDSNGIYYTHKKVGDASNRPSETLTTGMFYFDTSRNQLCIYNGSKWISYDGYDTYATRGSSTNRPVFSEDSNIGCHFFDITIKKPIWWNGTKWVDANGADV